MDPSEGLGIDRGPPTSPSSVGTDDYFSCTEDSDDPESSMRAAQDGSAALVPLTTSPPQAQGDDLTTLLEQILFFACGVGSSLCYIATLSSLVHFKLLYGADSFVFLNLAVYLPLLPISLTQVRWDQYFDIRYQSRRTFLWRGLVGFVLGLVGTLLMIRCYTNSSGSLGALVFHAFLQGTGGAILYGTLNQLASFVGSGDGRKNKMAVSAGIQASALVVLIVSICTGFGVHEASRFGSFLLSIIFIELLCFLLFLWLLLGQQSVAAAMIRRDRSLRLDEEIMDDDALMETPLLDITLQRQVSSPVAEELPFVELFRRSSSCCLVLLGTLVPSFLVGSWFTRVQTDWMALASFLFYVRIASDFLGRLATIVVPPRTISCLTWTCFLRLLPVTLFFLNAHQKAPFADFLSIVLVAVIAFLSGYLATGCFQLAPLGLESQLRDANVAKQASILTVAFAVSAIGGLLSSFTLMALGV